MNLTKKTITVSEIFGPTIQGEGALIGRPTLFVRTGGCDFRCRWCDSMHAVDEKKHGDDWEEMEAEAVMERLLDLSGGFPMLVSLSGGNPATQPFDKLIELGHRDGYEFALETQGTIPRDWFAHLDHLVLSPKGPSSGMPFHIEKLVKCLEATANVDMQRSLKVVVFDEGDYGFARELHQRFPTVPMYLQAGTEPMPPHKAGAMPFPDGLKLQHLRDQILNRTQWLAEAVAEDRWIDVRVLPQLHVLVWGDKHGV